MTWLKTLAATLLALAALGQTTGQAADCHIVRTSIEETICNSKWLLHREAALDEVYRRVLSRLDQREHDLLVDAQARWSMTRDAQCANKPLDPRETCIWEHAMERMKALEARLAALPAPKEAADKPFEGHWENCSTLRGIPICVSHTLFQKGPRVCGVSRGFATNSFYDRKLVWEATNQTASALYICGRPGADVRYWCPGDDFASPTGWQRATASEPAYVCTDQSGRFLGRLTAACAGQVEKEAQRWRPFTTKQQALPQVEPWLRQCLDDPDFPPANTIIAP